MRLSVVFGCMFLAVNLQPEFFILGIKLISHRMSLSPKARHHMSVIPKYHTVPGSKKGKINYVAQETSSIFRVFSS